MSVTRVTSQMQHFDSLQCKCCHAVLPIAAVFCGQCGMRVDKDEAYGSNAPLSGQGEIAARYRLISLIRRRPAILLSFALDTQLQRLVMLRDIDVSRLDEAAKKLAYTELQQEYDLLRRQEIKGVVPLIASHSYEDHLYSVAGWPFSLFGGDAVISHVSPSSRPYTLHDLLQSGIGLPHERIAVSWIAELAQTVERLHEYQIIIGELDPNTIIMSSYDYSSNLALAVSWLPVMTRQTLVQISYPVYPSSFRAPEALYGQEDKLADVYSLGALLYLLLTGIAPDPMRASNSKRHRMRSPRAYNSRINSNLDAIVMQALALEPDKRFQHAYELGEALFDLEKKMQTARHLRITFPLPPKSTPKLVEETSVSSDKDNNEIKGSKEAALPIQESNDETIQMEAIQEQRARSYWSRINTGPLSSQEKPTGEATMDEVQILVDYTDLIIDDLRSEVSKNEGENINESKEQVLSEDISEVASRPRAEDEVGQAAALLAPVVETPVEEANVVPLLETRTANSSEDVLITSPGEGVTEGQIFAEMVESEQSIKEMVHQGASIDVDQSQNLDEEVAMQLELMEEDITVHKQVEESEKVFDEKELIDNIIIEQEEGDRKEEGVRRDLVEEDITGQEQAEEKEEEVIVGEDLVEEKVSGQEQVDVQEDVLIKKEQVSEEVSSLHELVQVGENMIAERVEGEEEVTQQEEKPQSDPTQKEQIVSTSRALVPQSASHSEMLPALLPERRQRKVLARIKDLFISSRMLLSRQMQLAEEDANQDVSLFQRVQRFILGEQKHTTMAAALIETPMRIQPTQSYAIRIQVIGRDQIKDQTQTGGLTALACGDIVHIEVRLALYQSYAYMVQQADVTIPTSGYAAEVTVPMHPLSSGPTSRRERLYIFFMDKERNPLYERPFVIEIFVSPLVQLGQEGHNVLSIPI